MPDEIKPLSESDKQLAANAAASEEYKKLVGQSMTDGKQTAKVVQYIPSRLTGGQPRQCFLVNYGHQNVSFFVPCLEFSQNFKPVAADTAEQKVDAPLPT